MLPKFMGRALLLAFAMLLLCQHALVEARWGQGGGAGKRAEKEKKIFEEAFKLEMEAQGLEDPEAIDEALLVKRVRKMNREATEAQQEKRQQRRMNNKERDQDYMRSGRFVRDMAGIMAAGIFLMGLYAFRVELGFVTVPKQKRY
mmetsp:Transcript_19357/g.73152  ORF Transcript_19357/g.73152 Transcript_19357/m.73152 type:complete len:145 (-) Transcript_19357:261-695(-)